MPKESLWLTVGSPKKVMREKALVRQTIGTITRYLALRSALSVLIEFPDAKQLNGKQASLKN